MTETLHSLASFQQTAVDSMAATLSGVAAMIAARPEDARKIALASGTVLLQAPTGSGKTLMLGRTLEALKGALPMPTIWLWFAPYAGLVTQTRDALADQCPALRLRDLASDRDAATARDGDVYVQSWAAVAASDTEARRVRRERETAPSLDAMLVLLRGRGFRIGVVIDEAHIAFRSATVAAQVYLQVLAPDLTLLATATPNDEKLAAFAEKAHVNVEWRVTIPRDQVVAAGLNKVGLMVGAMNIRPEDANLLDYEQAVLTAGWTQHNAIRDRLADYDIGVVPLMLVQVEDQAEGGSDPVARVKAKLLDIGVPESAIAVHTSGQPDANFHTLAYDPARQVLIFKVAVATGFDAPRAWTLVSVRPNRGRDFGLQIVGRIMRVHPAVRPLHGTDALLDRGYVFLTDPEMQAGLDAAATELQAVRESLSAITDRLDVIDYAVAPVAGTGASEPARSFVPQAPVSADERQQRLADLIASGIVPKAVAVMGADVQDRAIVSGEILRLSTETPLFADGLPEHVVEVAGPRPVAVPRRMKGYRLRRDLGVPTALWQELPPSPGDYASPAFLLDVARAFCDGADLVARLAQRRRSASVSLHDVFLNDERELAVSLRLSNRRIAEAAQAAFNFNDSIDPRHLKPAIIQVVRERADQGGYEYTEEDLRRAVDLAALQQPEVLKAAVKSALAGFKRLGNGEPLPDPLFEPEGLPTAKKAAHGVFPTGMNGPEARFASFLDDDDSGTVQWWLRNPHNATWATRLILPTGRLFFPDFAVGIRNRSTPDQVALVEIKDDGIDGRLHGDTNQLKIQVQHREYRNVFWATQGDNGAWERLDWSPGLNRIVPRDRFQVGAMVLIG